MYLEFGETHTKQSIHISQVLTGAIPPEIASSLVCPYCAEAVRVSDPGQDDRCPSGPHFVHAQTPCRYVRDQENHIRVPLYPDFEVSDDLLPEQKKNLLTTGRLPLADFYRIQERAIKQEFARFQEALWDPSGDKKFLLTDLKLFEWTLQKFARFTLCFLKIQTDVTVCYHIGSTDQSIETYLVTIKETFPSPEVIQEIHPLLILPKMSSVEYYSKFRFREHQHELRTTETLIQEKIFREYFVFSEKSSPFRLEDVLKEFKRLRYVESEHRQKVLQGMHQAKAQGIPLGRPVESTQRFLRKKKSRKIADLLQKGLAIKAIQRKTGYSINTIRKVKALLQKELPSNKDSSAGID